MASKINIVSIVGARPSFVKVAPIAWELKKHAGVNHTIVHTGQHYDQEMYSSFFDTLKIPHPNFDLGVGSGPHGKMTGDIMRELEQALKSIDVDWVVVYGASNSTLAGALTAAKLGIKIAHIESGFRVADQKNPELINRRVAERVSDLLFITGEPARQNLLADGYSEESIKLVGNLMIDTLKRFESTIGKLEAWKRFGLEKNSYLMVTLHQPYNVDDPRRLGGLIDELLELGETTPVLFPVHPRASMRLSEFGLMEKVLKDPRLMLTSPQEYQNFISLIQGARGLVTDSGGIADETTYFGIPCLTLRPHVERAITMQLGTNDIVPLEPGSLLKKANDLLDGKWKKGQIPPYWDGKAAERICERILSSC